MYLLKYSDNSLLTANQVSHVPEILAHTESGPGRIIECILYYVIICNGVTYFSV